MNYFSPSQKLVGITADEANTLRIGLIHVINLGIWPSRPDSRPLAPQDLKHEKKIKEVARKMIDELEEILYTLEYEEKYQEKHINRTSSMGAL